MSDHVKYEFVRYTRGYGLDLCRGVATAFPHFLGLREKGDEGAKPPNLPVDSFADLGIVDDGKCDFIVAAGIKITPDRVREWLRCIRDGGYLCIYDPKARYSRDIEVTPSPELSTIRRAEWDQGAYGIWRKGDWPPEMCTRPTACVVRHGGIGDQLQAAYLLPELKRQGYHVTVLTTEKGQNLLLHDPHIDDWYLIDTGQVPVGELPKFWAVTAKHYDKFVNLNESVEGTFLAMPGRPAHQWPHRLRHKMLNHNYAEFAASLAEIPFVPEGQFHATAEETQQAQQRLVDARAALAKPMERGQPVFVILWALSGSSPHKFTPHMDTVLKMVFGTLARAVVIFVGDNVDRILEAGWENEPRVTKLCGELAVRETLALAQQVELVVGPETGVLNAVCYAEVPKVVLLSHSSAENLTKHWVRTHAIPGVAPCAPCHQLHYTSEFCPQDDKVGGAFCQAGVDPRAIFRPIGEEYEAWVRVQMLKAA